MARSRIKPAVRQNLEAKGRRRAQRIAEFIVAEIRRIAPYDAARRPDRRGTRHLANSYYVNVDPADGEVTVRTSKRYWEFVEYGTREHGRAQPHVRPAIDAARSKFGVD